jgi:hypothetical protein
MSEMIPWIFMFALASAAFMMMILYFNLRRHLARKNILLQRQSNPKQHQPYR